MNAGLSYYYLSKLSEEKLLLRWQNMIERIRQMCCLLHVALVSFLGGTITYEGQIPPRDVSIKHCSLEFDRH